jgi:hypothetical protein
MDKHIHKGNGFLVHCPNCRGVVMKNMKGEAGKKITFTTRCPHCRDFLLIKISLDPSSEEPLISVKIAP